MDPRPLGSTGLEISPIVFGAGAVGGAVFTGPVADRTAIVRHALARGITWIDTAASYGDGESEENLGRILAEIDARPRLSTKFRIAAGETADIPGAAARSLERSLARLRRPAVDLVQLHNRIERERDDRRGALSVEDVLGPGGVADAIDALRDRGLATLAGFTALGDPEALHAVVASGRFDTLQAYHNLLNPSASRPVPARFAAVDYRGLIGAAAARGMGVLNIRVLAAGVIGGRPARAGGRPLSDGSDAEADAARTARVAGALAGEHGTLAQSAIRFALQTPGVSGVLVGFSTIAQVDEAVDAAAMPPLDAGALARLDALVADDVRPG